MGLNKLVVAGCLLLAATLQGTFADGDPNMLLDMNVIKSELHQRTNGTYHLYCESSAECDVQNNMFCDNSMSKCQCLPNTAYDSIAQACRVIRCGYSYNYNTDQTNCPDGYTCRSTVCTSYCSVKDYDCNPNPEVLYRYDPTIEIAFYSVLALIVAFFGVLILICLCRRCKRIRCKRVVTQHGQTVLVADSREPLTGNEMPTKVYSLFFCVPPVTNNTSYIASHPPAVPTQYDVKQYKELPPTYFGPPITDESTLLAIPTESV